MGSAGELSRWIAYVYSDLLTRAMLVNRDVNCDFTV